MWSVHRAVVRRGVRPLAGIALAAITLVLAVVVPGSGSVARGGEQAAPRPFTLLSTKGSIQGFGQDGGWIVWADASAPCQQRVKIRRASGGPVRSMLSKQGVTCKKEGYGYSNSIAVAGTRALWGVIISAGNTEAGFSVRTSSLARSVDREVIHPVVFDGTIPTTPFAGDGATLVGVDTADEEGSPTLVPNYPGLHPAFRVGVDGRPVAIPNADHSGAVSASGTSLAVVRRPNVDVRDVQTGALRLRIPLRNEPVALALTRTFLAVLVSNSDQLQPSRLLVYSLDGKLRRSVAVPRSTARELDADGRWVVYRTGKTIRALDLSSGRTSILTVAKAEPFGLSLEGRRLAWAEEFIKQSRIRALTLPR